MGIDVDFFVYDGEYREDEDELKNFIDEKLKAFRVPENLYWVDAKRPRLGRAWIRNAFASGSSELRDLADSMRVRFVGQNIVLIVTDDCHGGISVITPEHYSAQCLSSRVGSIEHADCSRNWSEEIDIARASAEMANQRYLKLKTEWRQETNREVMKAIEQFRGVLAAGDSNAKAA